ncbi:MAG: hypothetical protein HY682_09730 [Chloroflexi bacterium]|nr:hypothetical protein [Chloroflexota bacterium]
MDRLFADLVAFFGEYRRGDLEGDVDEVGPSLAVVWLSCSCGARLSRPLTVEPESP